MSWSFGDCGFRGRDWDGVVGEERRLDEDGDFGRAGVGIGDGDCAMSGGGRFGKLIGVGDGSGAPKFGAALLAGFAGVGRVSTLIC